MNVCGSVEHQAHERWREEAELNPGCWRRWVGSRASRRTGRRAAGLTKPEHAISWDPAELAWEGCPGCWEPGQQTEGVGVDSGHTSDRE